MKKNKIEEIAITVYKDHHAKFGGLKQVWAKLVTRYENTLREGSITSETQSKTLLGQAFSLVENFTSRVIAQVPSFHYLPREKSDVDFVEQYEEFSRYQHDQAKSKEGYEMIAKWGSICGMSGYKMGWKTEHIIHKKKGKEVLGKIITNPALVGLMDIMKLGKSVKVDDDETISNWTIDSIPPFDLIWSVNAMEKDDCYVLGHMIHNKTFKQLKQEGYDTRKLAQRIRNDVDYWKEKLEQYKGESSNVILGETTVEIAELGIKVLNETGMWEYHVVTLADVQGSTPMNPVSIRTEPNPFDKQFNPVGIFRPIKRPGKMYGYGIIENVQGVLDSEEDTLNMVMEAFWTDVSRPMEYVPSNVINEKDLEFKPRTLVPVRKLGESVNVLPTPSPNMSGASFILGYLERAKQNISAITDYQTGANQVDKAQTATEIRTKSFLSEQRTNKILQRFETEVLEPTGKMALWMTQQYLADEKEIIYRVLGKKGRMMEKKIKLKAVEAIKDVVIVAGSSAYIMQDQERAKWMSLYQLAMNEASMGQLGIPISRDQILGRLLEQGYGIKDVENFIPSLKEQEEAGVGNKLANLKDAKEENLSVETARVLPTDIHEVHIPVHKAAINNGGMTSEDGEFIEYTPEQMQMLVEHLNTHTRVAGGDVPSAATAMEQRASNNITGENDRTSNNGVSSAS